MRRRVVLAALLVAVAVGAVSAAAATFASPTPAQEIATSGIFNNVPFCGTKPITLAVLDGFGINAWSQESYAAVRSEAAKCKNVKVTVAAGGDLQKSISDISGAVAQGANAIVVIPDFGQSELPAIQQATKAGVKVVPWAANPGGTNGTDFVSYVDWLPHYAGTIWAKWMAGVLHGKGNVIYLGGPAGNPVGMGALANMVKVFKQYPGIKLLTGSKGFAVTNWDPATAQKVTAALLAKYPKIDGIITNYGTDALAATRAFQAAGRKLVPVAGGRCERPLLPLQEAGHPARDRLDPQLARPDRGAQGDRRCGGPAEHRAQPAQARLVGEHDGRQAGQVRRGRSVRLLPVGQDLARSAQAVRNAVGR